MYCCNFRPVRCKSRGCIKFLSFYFEFYVFNKIKKENRNQFHVFRSFFSTKIPVFKKSLQPEYISSRKKTIKANFERIVLSCKMNETENDLFVENLSVHFVEKLFVFLCKLS